MWGHYGCVPVVFCATLTFGCTSIPRDAEQGAIEISKVRDAIDCELVSVAINPDPEIAKYDVAAWDVKSNLNLTVVGKIGVDGKAVWLIPHSPAPTTTITPTVGLGGTDKSIAQIDFSTKIKEVIPRYRDKCIPGADPSETGLGLAAWLESTLITVDLQRHKGMSYTSEFEIVGSVGARFGHIIRRLTTEAGLTASRTGTNRLTVIVAPPQAPPGTPKAIPVYVVPKPEGVLPDDVKKPPQVENPILDRLLQRQAPIRLEPQ